MNLCLGAAYGYSVFLTPLQRGFGWTRPELSVAFPLSIAFISVGVLAGGRWQDRRGPAVIAPLAGGWIFDATHGYTAAFRIAALPAVAAGVVVATVRAPPPED